VTDNLDPEKIKEVNDRKIREFEKLHQRDVQRKINTSNISLYLKKKWASFLEWRKESNGFLTKADFLYNPHEWHAASWGAGLMFLYFLLDMGMFLVLFVTGILKVWKDALDHESCSSKLSYFESEIGKNVHYYLGGGILVATCFVFAGHNPPSIEAGIMATLLKAVLGV